MPFWLFSFTGTAFVAGYAASGGIGASLQGNLLMLAEHAAADQHDLDVNQSIHIEGKSKPEEWDDFQVWQDKYDHPLWRKYADQAAGAGHGGMDFFVIHAFIEALKAQAPMPIDIYDAVTWSAITPLSEQSVAQGFQTLDFPDFTAGQWRNRKPIFAFDAG